ncbi:Putative disease resistance RPP13-like protein [Arachis hypogaea]|nr:Putative disease resistance RPP13-like protein [Arachis hypogaea]
MAGSLVGGAFLSGFINVVLTGSLQRCGQLGIGQELDPDLVKRLKISLHAAEAVLDDAEEDDQQALLKVINDSSESELSVIPIVGMGGVGKTTLAKWVYNTTEGFDFKAWVCISETFDVVEIIRKTIEEITKTTCSLGSLNLLQNKLLEILSGKKFFVVLDDIWSDDADNWKKFTTPFHCGENACFPESNGNPTLEDIGRKIVNKCKGLPLAVETLGRLLQGKDDAKEWNAVLSSDIWEFPMKNSKIIPALLISYFQLPAYLKRCFVYCSLYPKDYLFEKDELILLWMAEDLLRPPTRGESLKEVGCKCFEELASRLFLKPAKNFSVRYVMHDLLHDLAIFLAGDFYCRIEEHGEQEKKKVLTRHLSHLSYRSLDNPIAEVLESIVKSESLRTSLYIDDLLSMESRASKLNYLRVLSFRKLDVLPDSIGKLIHLRYLNLSWTNVKTLPESLCNLFNLQTLILHQCRSLTLLPNDMHKLVNLQHLDLRGTLLEEMPRGIGKLKHLGTLSSFVGKHIDNGIQELGGLSNLKGSIEIKKLENVVDVRQARSAGMLEKNHIDNLSLKWCSVDWMVSNTETERDILDSLQPHNDLKVLTIEGYKGTIFPDWLGHCSYNNMTYVSLLSCKNCCMLPSLGQLPSLKYLRIKGLDQLRSIGEEFYKNEGDHHSSHIARFPSLERLEFDNMACWEVWHIPESETFPQIRNLRIRNCPMLKEEMLNQLKIDGCRKLEFPEQQQHKYDLVELKIQHSCDSLTSLSLDFFPNIKNLEIEGCRNLESVSKSEAPHAALQRLSITYCSKLVSFAGEGLAAPNLTHFQVTCCGNLKAFAGEGLAAPNLTHLHVTYCDKLEALPRDMKGLLPSLHSLQIFDCPNICRLAEGGLPPNLKSIKVGIGQQQMRDLSWMANLHALTHLIIEGDYCHNIKSYPEAGSLPHLPSLTTLKIRRVL